MRPTAAQLRQPGLHFVGPVDFRVHFGKRGAASFGPVAPRPLSWQERISTGLEGFIYDPRGQEISRTVFDLGASLIGSPVSPLSVWDYAYKWTSPGARPALQTVHGTLNRRPFMFKRLVRTTY